MSSKNRFSIDDAFESDDDEPIRVYGSTTESIPLRTKKHKHRSSHITQPAVLQLSSPKEQTENSRESLLNSGTASGSKQRADSLHSVNSTLSASSTVSTKTFHEQRCWRHPKVRENWKVVTASVLLLFAGLALVITGIAVECSKSTDVQSFIFFITGFLCIIPGAYHIVVICCAIKGTRGFSFYQLPTIK